MLYLAYQYQFSIAHLTVASLGRKDRSGRVIPHTIILPKSMSADVNSVDDLMKKAWPLLKDDFASFYEEPSQRY